MSLASWAQREAGQRLGTLEKRWGHSRAVARRAELVGRVVDPADRDVLVAAAYLHDVGHAPSLAATGFHPLDGARWLAGLGHDRLAGLVAHHTGSKHEAALRGLSSELATFPEERTLVLAPRHAPRTALKRYAPPFRAGARKGGDD
jgi:HD superfamily phosphodiesterase